MVWKKMLTWIMIIFYLMLNTQAATESREPLTQSEVLKLQMYELKYHHVIYSEVSGSFYMYNRDKVPMYGGFGTVYTGFDEEKQRVAIKKIKLTTKKNYSTFMTEVNMMQKLHHDNIIKLIDVIATPLDDHKPYVFGYIVTEYCEGGELFDVLVKDGPFSEETTKQYLEQIITGVEYMHKVDEKGIIHRDLKLENILLVRKNSTAIKIIDFGLSYDCDSNQGDLKNGTPNFMAPESFKMTAEKFCEEKQVDVWSLGVMLYIMLSQTFPYKITRASMKSLEAEHYDFQFSGSAWEDVSDEAKDLVIQMLTLDPYQRIKLHDIMQHPWWEHHREKPISISIESGIEKPWTVDTKTMRITGDIDTLVYQQGVRIGWKMLEYYDEDKNNTVPLTSVNMDEYQNQVGFYTLQKNKFDVGDTVESLTNFKQKGVDVYRLNIKKEETFVVTNVLSEGVQMTNEERTEPCVVRYTNLPNLKKKKL